MWSLYDEALALWTKWFKKDYLQTLLKASLDPGENSARFSICLALLLHLSRLNKRYVVGLTLWAPYNTEFSSFWTKRLNNDFNNKVTGSLHFLKRTRRSQAQKTCWINGNCRFEFLAWFIMKKAIFLFDFESKKGIIGHVWLNLHVR